MPTTVPYGELIGIAVDAGVLALSYKVYRDSVKASVGIKEAPNYDTDSSLKATISELKDKVIPYACISGIVTPIGKPLKSKYDEDTVGVIQQLQLKEYRSKRSNGYWTDGTRVIRDAVNHIRFSLSGSSPGLPANSGAVEVCQALDAEQLMDDLKVTYDKYEPNRSSLLERGLDRIFGEVSKGMQETENMLEVGASMVGIGKLVLENDAVKLMPPTDGRKYILSLLTKDQIIKKLEGKAWLFKVLTGVLGAIALGLALNWVRRMYKWYKEQRDYQQMLDNMRRLRQERAQTGEENREESAQTCVVCLSNPRDVVLLNCGHICVCAECAESIPDPKLCPVCRATVVRIIPTYIS